MTTARRKLRLLGHPVHVAAVHFPIALLSVAPFWDLVGLWRGDPAWWRLGVWTLALGLAASLPAALSGLLDYRTVEGTDVARTAERHLYVVLAALGTFAGAMIVRGGVVPGSAAVRYATLALEIGGALALAAGAWLGGELVLRHGVGRVEDSARSPEDAAARS